ncbi:CYTH domain-containing protein [Candidatus Woesearchaeota archaeon]|nr:CYTH domain-containing protein [Candidatus Woesearchaeota archaeon]
MTAKREIESKFELPIGKDILLCTTEILEQIAQKGWNLTATNLEPLHFVYYDTPQLDLYQQGATLRRISGYPTTSKPKAAYRYDYKTGSLENRMESTLWSRWEWNPEKIIKKLAPELEYTKLEEVAKTDTFSFKLYYKKWFTQVEVSVDAVSLVPEHPEKKKINYFGGDGPQKFRELEIELLRGSEKRYEKLVHQLQEKLQFTPINEQKYGRVIGMKKGNV